MGCGPSHQHHVAEGNKTAEIKPMLQAAPTAVKRTISAESKDSGIEAVFSSEEGSAQSFDQGTALKNTVNHTGGIAFEIDLTNEEHNVQYRRKIDLPTSKFHHNHHHITKSDITLNEISNKQAEASRRREAERLAIIGKQRRRDLQALKVAERKKRRQANEQDPEDDLSRSDIDETFNVDADFDWNGNS